MSRWDQAAYEAACAICESPIEKKLLRSLLADMEPQMICDADADGCYLTDHLYIRITPQERVMYAARVDFGVRVELPGLGELLLALECDGFDYHDRRAEDAARDKHRDRMLRIAGYQTLRFTGQEINRDAPACARSVADVIDTEYAHRIRRYGEDQWRLQQGRNDLSGDAA